ncbi:MAG: hypothetical protein JRJ26_00180 [Deltaproteobacteria bacterium]|nr:hypothetical protein [Deltaproteobacteria bacterium]
MHFILLGRCAGAAALPFMPGSGEAHPAMKGIYGNSLTKGTPDREHPSL